MSHKFINYEITEDKIIFNDSFNEKIEHYIDILSLKETIHFGSNFNQNLSCLPFNIKKIYLGKNFNNPLDNIPYSIISIIFSTDSIFNNSLDYLHNYISEIILPDNYDRKITKFPKSLKTLVLGNNYKYKLIFPDNLIYLSIGRKYIHPLNNLPKTLETLFIDGVYNEEIVFPEKLKHLTLLEKSVYNKKLVNLPDSLLYLSILNEYDLEVDDIDSILCLSLGNYYNGNIILPKNLKKLKLSQHFSYKFESLPISLETIEVYSNYLYLYDLKYKYKKIKLIIKN